MEARGYCGHEDIVRLLFHGAGLAKGAHDGNTEHGVELERQGGYTVLLLVFHMIDS